MMEAFSHPSWTPELTEAFIEAVGPGYEVVQAAADRHGSWEWVARARNDEDRLVTSLVTALSLSPGEGDVPSSAVVVAWQGSAEADEIDPRLIVTKRLRKLSGSDGPLLLASALKSVVRAATSGRPSNRLRLLWQRLDSVDVAATGVGWSFLIALCLQVLGLGLSVAGVGGGWYLVGLTLPVITAVLLLGVVRDNAAGDRRSKSGV